MPCSTLPNILPPRCPPFMTTSRRSSRRTVWIAKRQRLLSKTSKRCIRSGDFEPACPSAPLVLRILPLQFLFHPRVMVPPESGQVLGDLNGSIVGGQDVDQNRDFAERDARRRRHAVKFLNAN